jgi:hypothetical protein
MKSATFSCAKGMRLKGSCEADGWIRNCCSQAGSSRLHRDAGSSYQVPSGSCGTHGMGDAHAR